MSCSPLLKNNVIGRHWAMDSLLIIRIYTLIEIEPSLAHSRPLRKSAILRATALPFRRIVFVDEGVGSHTYAPIFLDALLPLYCHPGIWYVDQITGLIAHYYYSYLLAHTHRVGRWSLHHNHVSHHHSNWSCYRYENDHEKLVWMSNTLYFPCFSKQCHRHWKRH